MAKKRRAKGDGGLYKQPKSPYWYTKITVDGESVCESTKTDNERLALVILRDRLSDVDKGYTAGRNLTVDKLVLDKLTLDRRNNGKSYRTSETRWRLHLKPFFGGMKAVGVDDALNDYIDSRMKENAKPATIERELQYLRAAYRRKRAKIRVPIFEMPKYNNTRKRFASEEELKALEISTAAIRLWLRGMLAVGKSYGWRLDEVKALRVWQVDFHERTITLEVGTTKNDHGRIVYMTDEVLKYLTKCCEGKGPNDCVFTRSHNRPIATHYKAWKKATVAAGIPLTAEGHVGLRFHDLRRVGGRNLRRAGVPEEVAMKITGHRSVAMFRRYKITDTADVRAACELLNKKQREKAISYTRMYTEDSERFLSCLD